MIQISHYLKLTLAPLYDSLPKMGGGTQTDAVTQTFAPLFAQQQQGQYTPQAGTPGIGLGFTPENQSMDMTNWLNQFLQRNGGNIMGGQDWQWPA